MFKGEKLEGLLSKESFQIQEEFPLEEKQLAICEMLLVRHKRVNFLHRIVAGNENWICCGNLKHRKAWSCINIIGKAECLSFGAYLQLVASIGCNLL